MKRIKKLFPWITPAGWDFILFTVVLCSALGLLFWRCFESGIVHFNNDTPMGVIKAMGDSQRGHADFDWGRWDDLNTVGQRGTAYVPTIQGSFLMWLGVIDYGPWVTPILMFLELFALIVLVRMLLTSPDRFDPNNDTIINPKEIERCNALMKQINADLRK